MRCVDCDSETPNIYRVCTPCITVRNDRELTAQGLPLLPSDETMRRLAVILAACRVRAEQTRTVA